MAQRDFLILGDSNVQRFYSKLGMNAKCLDYFRIRNLDDLEPALGAIQSTYKFVVLAFLTNLIVSAGDEATTDIDRLCAIESLFNDILPPIRCVSSLIRPPSIVYSSLLVSVRSDRIGCSVSKPA